MPGSAPARFDVGECAVVMRDRAWCQMTGWRLRLGQACTMTTLRGKPGSPPATSNQCAQSRTAKPTKVHAGSELRGRQPRFPGWQSGGSPAKATRPRPAFRGSPVKVRRATGVRSEAEATLRRKDGGAGESPAQSWCSSMVEQEPSKLMTRVRFPLPAPSRSALLR